MTSWSSLYGSFLKVGRGHITTALRAMASETPKPIMNIASDQDFRGITECRFFQDAVPGKKLVYLYSGDLDRIVPDWFVRHQEGWEPIGPPQLDVHGTPWYRVGYFESSELSGQTWVVYSAHQVNLREQP